MIHTGDIFSITFHSEHIGSSENVCSYLEDPILGEKMVDQESCAVNLYLRILLLSASINLISLLNGRNPVHDEIRIGLVYFYIYIVLLIHFTLLDASYACVSRIAVARSNSVCIYIVVHHDI